MSKNTKLDEILNNYKVGELKELAKISGITGYSKLKKAELVEAISNQLDTIDTTALELPDELNAALSDSEKTVETADQRKNNAGEKKTTRSSAPIIGVAPHVMNVKQAGQAPFTQLNRPAGTAKKIYPNELCPCGSGKKYKKCCGKL